MTRYTSFEPINDPKAKAQGITVYGRQMLDDDGKTTTSLSLKYVRKPVAEYAPKGRPAKTFLYQDEQWTARQLMELAGVPWNVIGNRIRNGWNVEDAALTPISKPK